jgi:hypothetical protein
MAARRHQHHSLNRKKFFGPFFKKERLPFVAENEKDHPK